ncbi:MAG TPA: hypothetical protein GXX36_09880 [Clostridiaceae bacterium]|nr:hypothetical protein [Clostridiaceae bacterium]
MEIEKRLAFLQNTYAVSIAETVNTYEKLKVLNAVVEKRKERQTQTALYLNQQLDINSVEDIFHTLSEIYGCANWAVKKIEDGYVAAATSCKLCTLSKKMGGANPCNGWCLDPMIAMITAAGGIDAENIAVESTLMNGDCCKIFIHIHEEQNNASQNPFVNESKGR